MLTIVVAHIADFSGWTFGTGCQRPPNAASIWPNSLRSHALGMFSLEWNGQVYGMNNRVR